MRVPFFTAGLLLMGALVCITGLTAGSAVAHARAACHIKTCCPCDCPRPKVRHAAAPRVMHRVVQTDMREDYSYAYAATAPMVDHWHGAWHVVPNDAVIAPLPRRCCAAPMAYGPPAAYQPYAQVDAAGFTGGVGVEADAGAYGGGFSDGYGQVHYANGGGFQNGPTYNSYGQSFPYAPAMAGPFVPQRMGAPAGR